MYHSDNGLSMYGARKHLGTLFFLYNYAMNLKFLSQKKKKRVYYKKKDEGAGRAILNLLPWTATSS